MRKSEDDKEIIAIEEGSQVTLLSLLLPVSKFLLVFQELSDKGSGNRNG
jgi:hypothetical protein